MNVVVAGNLLAACGLTSDHVGAGSGGASGATNGGVGGGANAGGVSGSDGGDPDVAAMGGVAGLAGSAGASGLVIQGTVECKPCKYWYSCWLKGTVPAKPGASPGDCPPSYDVDGSTYPYCGGAGQVSLGTLKEEGDLCCYNTTTFCE